jgi:hypothetical protein
VVLSLLGGAACSGRGGGEEAGAGGVGGSAGEAGAAAGASGGAGGAGVAGVGGGLAAGAWSPLSVMVVVDPKDHGAVGDGVADDLPALAAAVAALPAEGGVVYLPPGASFKKTNLLEVTKSHVKFWAPNRQAELFQSIGGQRRHQSVLCRDNTGCGFFGVAFRSDAAARFDALEDNQISADHATLVEVAGCDIAGSAAVGVFLYGSAESYIEGNYIHHTWADHIHHTAGARQSWVWGNFVFNDLPSKGDDGVACVTYGPKGSRCGDMEWWGNTILHTGWGRGYAVIGGEDISIHHNWAIGVAGAGLIVASEPAYDSATSDRIRMANNYVYKCAHTVGHPGILVSGKNSAAGPLDDIALTYNVSAETVTGTAYRAEGDYTNVTNTGLQTTAAALPTPIPAMADIRLADTSVMRTRDVSHVAAPYRVGLYRIHVRRAPGGGGFEQRFEYLVKGPPDFVAGFTSAQAAAGGAVTAARTVGATAYARVLTPAPVAVASPLGSVPFRDLRSGDQTGGLSWLWQNVDGND